jgi:hypothetical protein
MAHYYLQSPVKHPCLIRAFVEIEDNLILKIMARPGNTGRHDGAKVVLA